MKVSDAITLFVAHRQLKNVQPATLSIHQLWFRTWSSWRIERPPELASVNLVELQAFMHYLRHDYEPRRGGRLGDYSILSAWRSLRALWTFLARERLLSEEQTSYFPERLPQPKVFEDIRPVYSESLFAQILNACNSGRPEQQSRDRALLLMLAESGMRASEICSMRFCDFYEEERTAKIWGKGRKARHVFWGEESAHELAKYLDFRRQHSQDSDAVFCLLPPHEGELTYRSLRLVFRRLAKKAGVQLPQGASIHALRHTFARHCLNEGMDGLHLQQILGHSDIRTTTRYVRENPALLRKAHQKVFKKGS